MATTKYAGAQGDRLRIAWYGLTIFLSSAVLLVLANVAVLLTLRLVPVVIKLFLPLSAVALYAVAAKVSEYTFLLNKQFSNALMPLVSQLHGRGDHDAIRRIMTDGTRFLLALAVPSLAHAASEVLTQPEWERAVREAGVDPATIDWQSLEGGFPYAIRQEPGPKNALGEIKFIFPNEHAVFLHDTPNRSLFARPERAFSSGCIRVENPFELAELILNDPAKWDQAALLKVRKALPEGATAQVFSARTRDGMDSLIQCLDEWYGLAQAG